MSMKININIIIAVVCYTFIESAFSQNGITFYNWKSSNQKTENLCCLNTLEVPLKNENYCNSPFTGTVAIDKVNTTINFYNQKCNTSAFSNIIRASETYIIKCDKGKSGNEQIYISEWNFDDSQKANKVYEFTKLFEKKHLYSTIPCYYIYILSNKTIFSIKVRHIGVDAKVEAYCLKQIILQELIKNSQFETHEFSWGIY